MCKPPPYPLTKALVCKKIAKDLKQCNGPQQIQQDLKIDNVLIPRCVYQVNSHCSSLVWYFGLLSDTSIWKIVLEEAPDGVQLCDPAGHKKKKIHGHLTGFGVMQENHYDGHAKLGRLALRMGGVGIPIYGKRDHTSGKLLWLGVVPNDRNECATGHIYLDSVESNGNSK